MTFLAPALLALGLAVAVPLALHLLQRHQGPRMVFPALRYLRRAEREHATRIRLRQLLLLALRVLAILLLALAAARPFLPLAGPGHHPTSVVIVLDNAVSSGAVVGDRQLLDRLREAGARTLDDAGPDDRFWLIRAGEPWEPAITGETGRVAGALAATTVAAGGSDLTAEVERAASILAAEPEGRAREIHLLTDLRASAMRPASGRQGGALVLVLAPAARPEGLRAVTAVEVAGGMPPRAGERSTLSATITRFGGADAANDSADIRLVLDGAVRAVARAAGDGSAILPFPAHGPGLVTGRVEVDPDVLPAAARRYFAIEVSRPPAVAAMEPQPFMDEALAVLEEAGRLRRTAPSAADIVIASGAVGSDMISAGRTVVVLPPTTPLELAAANQRLAAARIPYRLGTPMAGTARLDAAGSGLERVLDEVRLREVYGLEPDGAVRDSVLLRLGSGEPWAVTGRVPEGGRYLLLASAFTPEASSIPTSAAMVPLLDRVLNAWALAVPAWTDHRPGDVVTLPAADSLLHPDGTVRAAGDGAILRMTAAGVYRVLRNDSVVAAYAVNPAPADLDPRPADRRALSALIPGDDVRVIPETDWRDAVFHRRLGREASLPLVLVAILVLLAESAIAASGRRTPTRPTG